MKNNKREVAKTGVQPPKEYKCRFCGERITDDEFMEFFDGEGNPLYAHFSCNDKYLRSLKI